MPTFMFRLFMEGPNNNKQPVHSLQVVLMLLLMLMLTEFKQSYAYACFCAFAFSTLMSFSKNQPSLQYLHYNT